MYAQWCDREHELPAIQPRSRVAERVEIEVIENIQAQRNEHEGVNRCADSRNVTALLDDVAADQRDVALPEERDDGRIVSLGALA